MRKREARMKERDNLKNLGIDGALMKVDLQDIRWWDGLD